MKQKNTYDSDSEELYPPGQHPQELAIEKSLHEIMSTRFGEDWLAKAKAQHELATGKVR